MNHPTQLSTWVQALGDDWFTQFSLLESKLPKTCVIYPPHQLRLRALELCSFEQVRVVIIGQDPYHQPNQANGLAFSVNRYQSLPKSLANIFHELQTDVGINHFSNGDLTGWAQQGVLLINTLLSVEEGKPLSHKDLGWQTLTDRIFTVLDKRNDPIVFILWGKEAQEKQRLITNKHHLIISSAHPSPLAAYRGFFGSRPFSKVNEFLMRLGLQPIDWSC